MLYLFSIVDTSSGGVVIAAAAVGTYTSPAVSQRKGDEKFITTDKVFQFHRFIAYHLAGNGDFNFQSISHRMRGNKGIECVCTGDVRLSWDNVIA